ncbi:Protein sof1 [Binucleata daphniae]
MIIKIISHDTKKGGKERKNDLHQNSHNKPSFAPFQKQREYVQALNSAKVDRLLAKPFISALSDHKDGIKQIEKHAKCDKILSSSFDGSVILYNKSIRNISYMSKLEASGIVKGLAFFEDDILVGNRNYVMLYDQSFNEKECIKIEGNVNSINYGSEILVAHTSGLDILDHEKFVIKNSYIKELCEFGTYNTTNEIIGATCGKELVLVDERINQEVFRNCFGIKTNCLSFSPTSPYFVTGNEDHNAYLHDMRYLDNTVGTFRHHVNAITSIDYNPSGREFVTGSYDKTVRIFRVNERKSREVYYNKRMQMVNAVKYNTKGDIIYSGSDDGSLRLWKNEASTKLEELNFRERNAINAGKMLREKYKDVPEINEIMKRRFLPKSLRAQMKNKNEHYKAIERRKQKYQREQESDE